MKFCPAKGWAIIARNKFAEWPLGVVFDTKRDAVENYVMVWGNRDQGFSIFNERIRNGSIRVARVKIVIDEDAQPKKPAKKEVKK